MVLLGSPSTSHVRGRSSVTHTLTPGPRLPSRNFVSGRRSRLSRSGRYLSPGPFRFTYPKEQDYGDKRGRSLHLPVPSCGSRRRRRDGRTSPRRSSWTTKGTWETTLGHGQSLLSSNIPSLSLSRAYPLGYPSKPRFPDPCD